jgi:hypothetical protein
MLQTKHMHPYWILMLVCDCTPIFLLARFQVHMISHRYAVVKESAKDKVKRVETWFRVVPRLFDTCVAQSYCCLLYS